MKLNVEELRQYFQRASYRPQRFTEIATDLQTRSGDRKRLKQLLIELQRKGEIIRLGNHRYAAVAIAPTVVGKFELNRRGFGFVVPEDGSEDVFVPPEAIAGALPGDRVRVQVRTTRRPGRSEGQIRDVLERGLEKMVGRVRISSSGGARLIPIGREIPIPVHLHVPLPKEFKPDTDPLVAVRVDWKASSSDHLMGFLEAILGPISDPAVDSKIVIHQNDLPLSFPDPVLQEAERVPTELLKADIEKRKDLRSLPFVTIDGEDARDHDDAITLDGENTAWIAIADVSHYVRPDTELDREAATRGNSYYFPDQVLPMLPPRLSNGICSLRPNEDRLVLATRIVFGPNGEIASGQLVEGIIRSEARLTYEGVDRAFRDRSSTEVSSQHLEMLRSLEALAKRLYQARIRAGGVDLDLSERKVVLDKDGNVKAMSRRERTASQQIVEELMLAANRFVAATVVEGPEALVYRVHDQPNERKLQDFIKLLRAYGYTVPSTKEGTGGRFLNELLRRFDGDPRGKVFSHMALRSMQQATYTPANIGHFGLGFSDYVHFTSPIRRYADLLVHRAARAYLRRTPYGTAPFFPPSFASLENLSIHISQTERTAQVAERQIVSRKAARFFINRVGQSYTGRIVGLVSKGFFVELDEHAVEGFVHVTKLRGDHFDFIEDAMILKGRRRRKTYRLGDAVTVRIDEVSLDDGRIELSLAA